MMLAVASGKGGTGKTTLAVNMAWVLGSAVQLLDCDVEEPNDRLFLDGLTIEEETVTVAVPQVDRSRCDGCAKVCRRNAIHEIEHRIGVVETERAGSITLIQGRLDVGMSMAPAVIREVKARLHEGTPAILDAPPGTSCPAIAAVRGADFVLLVTEPTPFGLHDLELAVGMVRELAVPCGVVVNRVGIGDDRVHAYCSEEKIPVLLEIPDDRRMAEASSRGEIIVESLPEYRGLFVNLVEEVMGMTTGVGH